MCLFPLPVFTSRYPQLISRYGNPVDYTQVNRETSLKYLIVGASGFVGRAVYRYLQETGYQVIGTTSNASASDLVIFDLLKHRVQDRIPGAFFASGEPVVTVICTGVTQIERCHREREYAHEVNVVTTTKLIQDLERLGSRAVYFSSNFVFDGNAGNYSEKHPRNPISVYGRHKQEVEQFVADSSPNTFVMRMDKLVSAKPDDRQIFAEWYRWIKAGKPILCISDQSFAPTYVNDVGRAVEIGCHRGLTGLYNVSNSEVFTRVELAERFVETLGVDAEIISKPQSEFGFLDLRPDKGNLNATRFAEVSQLEFTSIQEVLDIFARKARIEAR